MILATTLALLLAASPQQPAAAAAPDGRDVCGGGLSIHVADAPGTPANNVKLETFEATSPADPCAHNIDPNELIRITQLVRPLAIKAFAESQASFGVMIRYTLTADKPATFNMQVAQAPSSEQERLTGFYRQASDLKDFHATSGTMYVVLQFNITPALPGKHPKAG